MADSMYVGMNAAAARLRDLDAVADNLANVETPGFRAQRPVFHAVVADAVNGQVSQQVHVIAGQDGVDRRAGPAVETGSPLDIRLAADAWLAVSLEDGSTGYTRDGRLSVGHDGTLYAGAYPVKDDAGATITVPGGAAVRIGDHGEVFVDNERQTTLGRYEVGGQLTRIRPTVVTGTGGDVVPVDAGVEVGMRDGSSVNGVETAVRMVQAQRAYDEAMQAITTARSIDTKANELGRLR
ncbi:MAG TPA: flagellar hook-basal body complex protein [Myxococcota bacterium]